MPTPVSALIHAATLVTAGVYLLLRSSPLLEYTPTALAVIAWVGGLTTFYAATVGLVQTDLKRTIAFSTCSQVGLMIMAVGLAQYGPALYHLVIHAAVKATLFLAGGAVLHAMGDQQDLRRLGGLVSLLPYTYTALLVASLSLMATPFLGGFYSKDAVLEGAAGAYTLSGSLAFTLGTCGATLTAAYSVRLLLLTFFTVPRGPRMAYEVTHDAPLLMGAPIGLLVVASIVGGYLGRDLFLGAGSDYLSTALTQHPTQVSLIEAEFGLPTTIKLLPAYGTLIGSLVAYYLYQVQPSLPLWLAHGKGVGRSTYGFLLGKWQWDPLLGGAFMVPGLTLGHLISKVLDRGVIELVGPHGLSTVMPTVSRLVGRYETGGAVTYYALYMLLGVLVLLTSLYATWLLGGESLGLVVVYLGGVLMLLRHPEAN